MRDEHPRARVRFPDRDARDARAAEELAKLPNRILALEDADPPYPIEISAALAKATEQLRERVSAKETRTTSSGGWPRS